MRRLSTRSNPTNLREIERSRITISVAESSLGRYFTLDRLELEGVKLSSPLKVICIASAGNASLRFELGSLDSWSREGQSLDNLDRYQPLRFRLLLLEPGNPQIVASAENIRPRDDAQGESLLPMEPADLGERLWHLKLEEDGPVLQFNIRVFPNAAGVENYLPFGALVLPEALRQVMVEISADPARLDDENDAWCVWGRWLDAIGAERPPEEEEQREKWCSDVVAIFSDKHKFASQLRNELLKGESP